MQMNLIKQIEQNDIQDENIHIYFLGQSGYVIKTKDTIMYIDPYLSDYVENSNGLNDKTMYRNFPPPISPNKIHKLDAILCTHSHVDHMDPWTISKITTDFILYSSLGAYEKSPVEVSSDKINFLEPGKITMINEFKIEPIAAAHYDLQDEFGRPDCLSFIISCYDKTLLFWGDGILYEGLAEKLKQYKFDYFFAPINGRNSAMEAKGIIGNINAKELAELCKELEIRTLVPNHYDMFKNNSESVAYFMQCIKESCPTQEMTILSCGNLIKA